MLARSFPPNAAGARRAVLLAMALWAPFAWGACGQPQPNERPLRLAALQDPPGLNPRISDNAQLQDFIQLIGGFLLGTDAQGRFTPDLAREVPSRANGGISADGRTLRYRLRRNVCPRTCSPGKRN